MVKISALIVRFRRVARRGFLEICASGWIWLHRDEAARIRAEKAWLFGGNSGRAYRDNAAALCSYVREARPGKRTYWVIDPDSPDLEFAKQNGPVLKRDTLNTIVRARLAEAIVISHGVHDVPGLVGASEVSLRVRVGHGLTALKRTRPRPGHSNSSANAVFDLVPVASRMERDHKLDWGIPKGSMPITGVPRFDTLLAKTRTNPREPGRLLYMPTWRDEGAGALADGIETFVTDPKLVELLASKQARLDIVLHPNLPASVRARILEALPDGAKLQSLQVLQELMARADLLITDWSSVAWDMLYLDRPVVFYHVEPDVFAKNRGSHIKSNDFPGPVACCATELVDLLLQHVRHGLPDETRQIWRERAFAFHDDGNCARVLAEMELRLHR